MAKVFLSYAREDAAIAERLARALERRGHDVWWDRELHGGASFSSEIERQLRDCDVVVVLWSEAGLKSPWVRDEAGIGRDAGKLLPISIDGTEPPIGFRQFHSIELKHWHGGKSALAQVQDAIARLSAAPEILSAPPRPKKHWPTLNGRAALIAAAIALVLAGAASSWFLRGGSATTVAIVAANSGNPAMSRDYAQSIATDMGSFLASLSKEASVVEPERAKNATYRFNVAVATKSPTADASLQLSVHGQPGFLWSRNWTEVDLSTIDLKKQMALVASQALNCTLEGRKSRSRLKPKFLGLYVNGCIAFTDDSMTPGQLIDVYSKITAEAPDYAPGWADLALAYAKQADKETVETGSFREELGTKAATASRMALRLNPRSGKALMAQAFFTKRPADHVELMEKAVMMEPNTALLHDQLTVDLRLVGRNTDSVKEAQRAVELDPLSPETRTYYILALTYAGQFSRARDELANAQRIWPHSTGVRFSALAFHLRYGDPKTADALVSQVALSSDRDQVGIHKFIRARMYPSVGAKAEVLAAYRPLLRGSADGRAMYLLALGSFGEFDEAIRLLSDPGYMPQSEMDILFRPEFRPMRHDRRFMAVAARLGLVQYWRRSGHWPDFCSDPDLPYDCKAEAAKYPN